jgi:tRNA A37 threonylcarbamoyltransferase TsaD
LRSQKVKSSINCLGLEGTAHTFGVGIVNDEGVVLSNVWDEYIPHKGGIHPREAAQHHAAVVKKVISEAVEKADISIREINVVALSQGPGLSNRFILFLP